MIKRPRPGGLYFRVLELYLFNAIEYSNIPNIITAYNLIRNDKAQTFDDIVKLKIDNTCILVLKDVINSYKKNLQNITEDENEDEYDLLTEMIFDTESILETIKSKK